MFRLSLKVIPNSSKTMLIRKGAEVKIKITAPPVDGKANLFLIKYLSKELKVPKSTIHVVKGETSRHKVVEFEGLSEKAWNVYLSELK